ncbi:hypothetical protein AAF712_007362 [Marasmius tenuissimus]|uniref:Uncharacterized protein n=1 Tax=Marasmius tenuissimus TaxID=585030 RepID=A0ABR2ZWN8_9AGAR
MLFATTPTRPSTRRSPLFEATANPALTFQIQLFPPPVIAILISPSFDHTNSLFTPHSETPVRIGEEADTNTARHLHPKYRWVVSIAFAFAVLDPASQGSILRSTDQHEDNEGTLSPSPCVPLDATSSTSYQRLVDLETSSNQQRKQSRLIGYDIQGILSTSQDPLGIFELTPSYSDSFTFTKVTISFTHNPSFARNPHDDFAFSGSVECSGTECVWVDVMDLKWEVPNSSNYSVAIMIHGVLAVQHILPETRLTVWSAICHDVIQHKGKEKINQHSPSSFTIDETPVIQLLRQSDVLPPKR